MTMRLARLAAAVVMTAAAGVAVSAAPAHAAACSGSTGVSVVVDFRELGGGVQQACAPDGAGRTAASLFSQTGFPLTRVQSQPGFVCRVSGAPSNDPCVQTPPDTAYWGLWSSDGMTGDWGYASRGVDGLTVPDGGAVGFSWKQGSGAAAPPGAAPGTRAVAPAPSAASQPKTKKPASKKPATGSSDKPTPAPEPSPTKPPISATRTPSPSPSASGSPTVAPTRAPTAKPTTAAKAAKPTKPSGTASAAPAVPQTSAPPSAAAAPLDTPSTSTAPGENEVTGAPARATDSGLPTWVAPVLLVLLFGAAAGVAVVRRRRSP